MEAALEEGIGAEFGFDLGLNIIDKMRIAQTDIQRRKFGGFDFGNLHNRQPAGDLAGAVLADKHLGLVFMHNFLAFLDAEGAAARPIAVLELQTADVDHLTHGRPHPLEGCRPVDHWVIQGRRRHNAGQQGGLGKIEVGGAMPKIELRCGLHAIVLIGKENLVQIQFEDEVFVILAGYFQGDQNFVDFARQRDFGIAQDKVAGYLLGDRAGAGFDAALTDVLDEGADNGNRVKARVGKVAFIFLRDDGVNDVGAHVAERDGRSRAGLLAVERGD